MKWLLGLLCSLLLLNVLAQQQTVNELRAELKQAHLAAQAVATPATDMAAPTATPGDTPTPSDSATPAQTSASKRPAPRTTWIGDVGTCNKADREHDWWKFTHAYLSDPVKYASYKVWFLYSQSYVNSFAYCFDKAFVNKVNEVAATVG